MAKKILRLMTELSSRKSISQMMGRFSHSSVSRYVIPTFIRNYHIPASEAEKDISEYRTLNEFFTRRLKPGMRPIDSGEHSLTSPVDATITAMGDISSGTILNVKGQNYTVEEILHHSPHLELYKNGYVFVLYLSPTDYHRIHSPVTGVQTESEHIKGRVYPVNDFGMTHMPSVLSRNERLITYIAHSCGEVAVVKVGAMNVSSIQYTDATVNAWRKGDDLAYFEFGSTIVLLMENGTFHAREDLKPGDAVRMGQSLGELHATTQVHHS
ncbi:archaetidylserine decarboxylase [Paenibacillus sp. CMAA1364]